MEDMPLIFDKVDIDTTVKPGYDIYLMDDVPHTPPSGLVIHFKSKSLWCNNFCVDTQINNAES